MAISKEMRDLITRLNTATSDIAARLKKIQDERDAGGMSAEDEAAAGAEIGAIVTQLEAIGKDPADPLPEPPAEPTE